jgi:hypothetical protein
VVGTIAEVEMMFFFVVKGGSRTVRRGWSVVVVLIQCFGFGFRGKATGRDEALPKDEAYTASSSWLHRKEV